MPKSCVTTIGGAAVFCSLLLMMEVIADEPVNKAGPVTARLDVGGTYGPDSGAVISQKDGPDGKKMLHGMQVQLGPNNWLKEYSVFNEGVFEQRTQFYPSGKMFRVQWRNHNGDGSDVIYAPEADKVVTPSVKVAGSVDIGPIKVPREICIGLVKGDKRWKGTFLVRESIPNGYGMRLRMHQYRGGELIENKPFPVEQLKLPKEKVEEDRLLWDYPEWPSSPQRPRQ